MHDNGANAGPAPTATGSTYRPEIDGLRAIAVSSVILYHAGLPYLPAGFLGVDIFFVISGYLISGIIIGDLGRGRFSILDFYERRIRRIIPALVVMTLITAAIAYAVMMPGDLQNFGQSLVATSLSANNILLLITTDYFDLSAEFKPLVHTWSLGVEEQYYLVVPLLMIAAYRWRGRRGARIGVVAIALGSFTYCVAAGHYWPRANFYLIFSRAWELAAGAAVALAEPKFRREVLLSPPVRSVLAFAGLTLTIVPMLLLHRVALMPDARTLLPVAGVCLLLLFAHGRNPIARLLSARPLVFLGLLSYSLYLYHQPVFVFARLTSLSELTGATMALLLLPTFVLAYLSWRFVERPFRDRRRLSTRNVLAFCIVTSGMAVGLGLAMHRSGGFPNSWPAEVRNDEGINPAVTERYVEGPRRFGDASFGAPDARPNTLVLGDSFARDVINMGLETGRFANHDISYSDSAGCGGRLNPKTAAIIRQADFVILSAAYGGAMADCVTRLRNAIAGLSAAPIAIVGTKNFGSNNSAIMLLPPERRYAYRVRPLKETLEINRIAARTLPADLYINLIALLSDAEGRVPVFTPDHHIISQDTKHLTAAGARYIGKIVFAQLPFRQLGRRLPESAKALPRAAPVR